MGVSTEKMLKAISVSLTAGQGDFSEEDLAIAYEEIHEAIVRGEMAGLVLAGQVGLIVKDGEVLYTAIRGNPALADPMTPEALIENSRRTV